MSPKKLSTLCFGFPLADIAIAIAVTIALAIAVTIALAIAIAVTIALAIASAVTIAPRTPA